jgi:hypothetical protein
MKKFQRVLGTCALFGLAMGVSFASAFVPVDPKATYGTAVTQPDASAIPATWVLLSSLNAGLGITIVPGTTSLTFRGTGDLCYFPSCPASSPEINTASLSNPFLGGFTTTLGSTTFLLSSLGNTANTVASGDWTADFANDFFINSSGPVSVVVPTGAVYAVFVLRDSHYTDNANPDADLLGINITVPEPASYGLLLAGLGGLFAMRRFRRS